MCYKKQSLAHFTGRQRPRDGPCSRSNSRGILVQHRSRILVVEDEPLVQFFIEDALTDLGFELVGPASCTFTALKLIEAGGIDAALIDCTLNDGGCEPVTDALARRGVPFAVVSAHTKAEVERRFPGRPFIAKPFNTAELASVVSDLISEMQPDCALEGSI